jgi:predicted dehydrogenase
LDLIEKTEIIDFATPHPMDNEHASMAIRSARHLFLENKFLTDSAQVLRLMNLAEEARVKVQVSRSGRFNPAVQRAKEYIDGPSFVEIRRALPFAGNQANNAAVFDALLQDIDLIQHFVDSGVRKIQTRTNNSFSDLIELLNVRIEFDNACVANLNISTLSPLSYNKAAFYQENGVINIDLQNQRLEVLSSLPKKLENISLAFDGSDSSMSALVTELQSFTHCIDNNSIPLVGLSEVALNFEIIEEIKEQLNLPRLT